MKDIVYWALGSSQVEHELKSFLFIADLFFSLLEQMFRTKKYSRVGFYFSI